MREKAWILGLGLAGVFLLLLGWWAFHPWGGDLGPGSIIQPKETETFAKKTRDAGEKKEWKEDSLTTPLAHPPLPALRSALRELLEQLRARPDRETALRLLQEFMAKVLAMDPDRAAATLLEFLRSGEDQGTGLEFVVGEAGLEEWPTLRAFFLDLLGKIDPEQASQYALGTVIPAKNSTVEYAVALQILWNYGGAEKPTRELTDAWLGLLQKPDWAAKPDAAWMESLDFASRIPEATPQFLEAASPWLARPLDASGKAETVEMALERMMVRHPGETLTGLLQNPQWMNQGRGPALRATLFARVDANDSGQVQSLRTYLQRLDPSGKEAAAFYRAFPCHNYGVAPGLSGPPDLPGAGQIQQMLRADLILLQGWKTDPSLSIHHPWMDQAITRIQAVLGPGR